MVQYSQAHHGINWLNVVIIGQETTMTEDDVLYPFSFRLLLCIIQHGSRNIHDIDQLTVSGSVQRERACSRSHIHHCVFAAKPQDMDSAPFYLFLCIGKYLTIRSTSVDRDRHSSSNSQVSDLMTSQPCIYLCPCLPTICAPEHAA